MTRGLFPVRILFRRKVSSVFFVLKGRDLHLLGVVKAFHAMSLDSLRLFFGLGSAALFCQLGYAPLFASRLVLLLFGGDEVAFVQLSLLPVLESQVVLHLGLHEQVAAGSEVLFLVGQVTDQSGEAVVEFFQDLLSVPGSLVEELAAVIFGPLYFIDTVHLHDLAH